MTSATAAISIVFLAVSGSFPSSFDDGLAATTLPTEAEPTADYPSATITQSVVHRALPVTDDDRRPTPDASADYTGGIATRLHTADGTPVPGNVFLLMATAGSDATAQLFDETPYTHDNGTAADAHESNVAAVDTVETVTGTDIDLLELTTAPGGGPSGGITYTIAYLNVLSDGAFTGDLRIAATGRIGTHGYVDPINAIDEKTAAAHLADADVLFTPSTSTDQHLDTYGARHVGERNRARHTGNPLADERRLDNYHAWGADRPDGMDIIHVRHVADVAAYLCGTGSTYACHITELLEDTTTEFTTKPVDADEPSHDRMRASLR